MCLLNLSDVNHDGPLTPDQIEQYYHDGFVIVDDIIPTDHIKACLSGIDQLVDSLANDLHRHGLIDDLCADPNVHHTFNRLTSIDAQYKGAAVLLHKNGILPTEFIRLWELDVLNEIAFQLIQPPPSQPKIAANPIWNLRPKLP